MMGNSVEYAIDALSQETTARALRGQSPPGRLLYASRVAAALTARAGSRLTVGPSSA